MRTISLYAHQGDLVVAELGRAPVELALTESPVTLAGSPGREHVVPPGVEYARLESHHYVRPVVDVLLTHSDPDGHGDVPLFAGQVYHIYPQIERHGEHDVDVQD
jgi:hypothetical protein